MRPLTHTRREMTIDSPNPVCLSGLPIQQCSQDKVLFFTKNLGIKSNDNLVK